MNDVHLVGVIGAAFLVAFLFLAYAMGRYLRDRKEKK